MRTKTTQDLFAEIEEINETDIQQANQAICKPDRLGTAAAIVGTALVGVAGMMSLKKPSLAKKVSVGVAASACGTLLMGWLRSDAKRKYRQ